MRRENVLTAQRDERMDSARVDDRAANVRALRVHGDLTLTVAPVLCRAVADAVREKTHAIAIDVRGAKTADVVGLAALLQCGAAAERGGVEFSVVAEESLRDAVLAARLLEEIPFVTGASASGDSVRTVEAPHLPDATPLLTQSPRIGLRQPTWDELALFKRWADDRCLDEMVGSELLYRCRHLGAYHPDFVREILMSPTALTLVIEPLATPGHPVGFVRLYDIRLAEGIAFLETVVTTGESLRKGWGVEASRLLLAYALDVLGIQRVEAKAYSYNVLSANALRRNGFRREGVLRGAHRYQGQRWDIFVYSILEEEMRAQRTPERYPYVGFWTP
jgi:RimJ/RimL family protein N-acetyltransferase/anti-anti-sigma regulatory factor